MFLLNLLEDADADGDEIGGLLYFIIYTGVLSGITTTEKNCITLHSKSAAVMSLTLFSAMNERHCVLFVKCELSWLLLDSKMFI